VSNINPLFQEILTTHTASKPYQVLAASEYNAHPGITKSAICAARIDRETVSMAEMRAAMMHDRDDDSDATPSMRWGTLAHAVLFEPVVFAGRIALWSETKRGKAWEAFKAENEADGKWIVSETELTKLEAMRKAVQASRNARAIMADVADTELPICWRDPDYGVAKGRIDACGPDLLVEYKTCRDISKRRFQYSASDLGYHLGIAWYWHGYARPKRVFFIAQQSSAPFKVAVYAVQAEALERYYEAARAIAIQYRAAEQSGEFLDPYDVIQDFELPIDLEGNENAEVNMEGVEEL